MRASKGSRSCLNPRPNPRPNPTLGFIRSPTQLPLGAWPCRVSTWIAKNCLHESTVFVHVYMECRYCGFHSDMPHLCVHCIVFMEVIICSSPMCDHRHSLHAQKMRTYWLHWSRYLHMHPSSFGVTMYVVQSATQYPQLLAHFWYWQEVHASIPSSVIYISCKFNLCSGTQDTLLHMKS